MGIGKCEVLEEFIRIIREKRINPLGKDKLVWYATKNDLYMEKSSSDMVEGGGGVTSFSKRIAWKQLVLAKVGFSHRKLDEAR